MIRSLIRSLSICTLAMHFEIYTLQNDALVELNLNNHTRYVLLGMCDNYCQLMREEIPHRGPRSKP